MQEFKSCREIPTYDGLLCIGAYHLLLLCDLL